MYIVEKGVIEIFLPTDRRNDSDIILKKLYKGDTFGEISFFSNRKRMESVRSVSYSTVLVIK